MFSSGESPAAHLTFEHHDKNVRRHRYHNYNNLSEHKKLANIHRSASKSPFNVEDSCLEYSPSKLYDKEHDVEDEDATDQERSCSMRELEESSSICECTDSKEVLQHQLMLLRQQHIIDVHNMELIQKEKQVLQEQLKSYLRTNDKILSEKHEEHHKKCNRENCVSNKQEIIHTTKYNTNSCNKFCAREADGDNQANSLQTSNNKLLHEKLNGIYGENNEDQLLHIDVNKELEEQYEQREKKEELLELEEVLPSAVNNAMEVTSNTLFPGRVGTVDANELYWKEIIAECAFETLFEAITSVMTSLPNVNSLELCKILLKFNHKTIYAVLCENNNIEQANELSNKSMLRIAYYTEKLTKVCEEWNQFWQRVRYNLIKELEETVSHITERAVSDTALTYNMLERQQVKIENLQSTVEYVKKDLNLRKKSKLDEECNNVNTNEQLKSLQRKLYEEKEHNKILQVKIKSLENELPKCNAIKLEKIAFTYEENLKNELRNYTSELVKQVAKQVQRSTDKILSAFDEHKERINKPLNNTLLSAILETTIRLQRVIESVEHSNSCKEKTINAKFPDTNMPELSLRPLMERNINISTQSLKCNVQPINWQSSHCKSENREDNLKELIEHLKLLHQQTQNIYTVLQNSFANKLKLVEKRQKSLSQCMEMMLQSINDVVLTSQLKLNTVNKNLFTNFRQHLIDSTREQFALNNEEQLEQINKWKHLKSVREEEMQRAHSNEFFFLI